MKNYIIAIGLMLAFASALWSNITGDLTSLGVNVYIIDIVGKVFSTGTEAVAGVALIFHIVIPNINIGEKKDE